MIFIEILQLNCYGVPELPPSRNTYLSIYLPVSQTLVRDLDCHASTTKREKIKE